MADPHAPAGSVWERDGGEQLRVRGMNGEMIHYDMRDRSDLPWKWQMPLSVSYFTAWVNRHDAKMIEVAHD